MTEAPWYDEARKMLGVREGPGKSNNAAVIKLYAESGHAWVKEDSVAWCAAYVGAMLRRAMLKSSGSLAARSYLKWGERLDKPKLGCVVVFSRGNHAWQGHVGFYAGETRTHVKVLGGNQSNMVKIANYPKSRLLGYRWPSDAITSGAKDPEIPEPSGKTTANLNLRGAPNRGASILGVMPKGADVRILDQWCRVEYDGQIGWAHADYIKEI